jgi:light-regulated signal transduction histidine kinase (bacteriophytochrome)
MDHSELIRRNERLVTAMREFETLSLAVSHDFLQPMRVIDETLSAVVVRDRNLDDQTRLDVRRMQDAVRHMEALVENLTALCHAASQPMELHLVDMEAMVGDAWAATAHPRNARLVVGRLPKARAAPAMLRLVWANLLANAVARCADMPDPHIEVTGGGASGLAIYSVRDNGDDLHLHFTGKLYHAFEQFQKQSPHPGTGVALAIVQRIVTRHRGNVWIESAPDRGAIFQFSIGEIAAQDARA